MKVYRLGIPTETKRGIPTGPYSATYHDEGWEVYYAMCDAHADAKHPAPWADDGLDLIEKSEFCGFLSMRDLCRWFGPFWPRLARLGFRVHVYDVPKDAVRIGGHQVLARITPADLVNA